MSHLLPREPPVDTTDPEPNVVRIGDGDTETVMSVLTSDIARSILAELYREPATQSELAERVDTSIQNVDYHVQNLRQADLVDVVDEWYSEKGREMDVYGPTNEPFVLIAGASDDLAETRRAVDAVQDGDAPVHGD
jgi:DNA-binding transcriptional ArsR family regulator